MPALLRFVLPTLAAALVVVACSSQPAQNATSASPTQDTASASPSDCSFDKTVQGVTASQPAGGTPTVSVASDAKPPEDLVTETLCPGTGPAATTGSLVSVNYAMAPYSTGKQLESSFESGQPFTVPVVQDGSFIPGFVSGVEGMKTGEVRLVLVPAKLAYGKTPPPGSPFAPNEAFAFVLKAEVVQVSAPAPS